ncbi:MAG TPA: hydroxysqualene dehydroxylase HpnE [Rhizomicrobium sp.]|jgi:squalene-associated FAD-dependent desaturase
MTRRKVFVVGAGLAGLAAAVALVGRGVDIELFEAAPQAGGRCRSYFDPQLGMVIDNGNHLVLSGNGATFAYLRALGAEDRLAGPEEARFAFVELPSGVRWTLAPGEGAIPWWIFHENRRVPGTRVADYLSLLRLLRPSPMRRIDSVTECRGALWDRLMRPLLLAALNTEPEQASAVLAGNVLRETLAKGGRFYRPCIATPNLAAAFVEPATAFLTRNKVRIRLGERVRTIGFDEHSVLSLDLGDETVPVSANDRVILAVPQWIAGTLVPGVSVPTETSAIVNAHYLVRVGADAPPMLGVIGGTAEWLFAFPDRVSVTVSAADAIVERDRAEIAEILWRDVTKAYGLSGPLPAWQVVKEKRATFRATPEQNALRPEAATQWPNLILAGDWTATGLPATIEGAIRSGQKAARLVN